MKSAIHRHDIFHAIADPTRRRILELLRDTEQPATELHVPFRMTQSAVSQHLRVLRESGLVRVKRSGRERLYRAETGTLRPVADWTTRLLKARSR